MSYQPIENMIHLIIDTCVWIDLCKNIPDVREQLTLLVEKKKVRLILPSIIIDEWNKQKAKIIKENRQSFRGKLKNAKSLSEYLDSTSGDTLKKIFDKLQRDKGAEIALVGIQEIEYILNHPTTVILEITDTAKLQSADFALAKKAPFRKKNSMADALIIFRSIEYIASEGLSDCIFISSNLNDFGSQSNRDEVHEDLRELFEKHKIRYFANIGKATNEVEANLVSDESVQQIEKTVKIETLAKAIQEQDAQLMENIMATGISPVAEAFRAIQEQDAQLMENIIAAGIPPVAEALRTIREQDAQLMEKIMATGISPVVEAFRAIQEHDAQLMENIIAAGIPPVAEALRAIQEHDAQLIENIMAAKRSPPTDTPTPPSQSPQP